MKFEFGVYVTRSDDLADGLDERRHFGARADSSRSRWSPTAGGAGMTVPASTVGDFTIGLERGEGGLESAWRE